MEDAVNNSGTKSSSISSENINELKEILEIEKLSRLLEQFYCATGLGNAIVDLKGNILYGVGWKSICRYGVDIEDGSSPTDGILIYWDWM